MDIKIKTALISVSDKSGLEKVVQSLKEHKIKSLNVKVGLAINPDTEWEVVKPFMDKLDLILVMSVHPGFGGQKFIPTALDKLSKLREEINKSGREIHLEVDGGINFENVQSVIDAGADMIVAGTTTFKGGPSEYANIIEKLRGH